MIVLGLKFELALIEIYRNTTKTRQNMDGAKYDVVHYLNNPKITNSVLD